MRPIRRGPTAQGEPAAIGRPDGMRELVLIVEVHHRAHLCRRDERLNRAEGEARAVPEFRLVAAVARERGVQRHHLRTVRRKPRGGQHGPHQRAAGVDILERGECEGFWRRTHRRDEAPVADITQYYAGVERTQVARVGPSSRALQHVDGAIPDLGPGDAAAIRRNCGRAETSR